VHCVLIYNPVSGRERSRRAEQVRDVSNVLIALGHRVETIATIAPGSAIAQARDAAVGSAEILFACGGDGTVHEVIQGLVSESGPPDSVLGIIPLGSANALARHMRLSLDPKTAALQQIQGTVHTIPIGKVVFGDQIRYFAVMAGAGPDGALTYEVLGKDKSRLGSLAYYLHATRMFFTRRFPAFKIEYTEARSKKVAIQQAVGVMAIRVDDLGGLFSRLAARQASIHDTHLRLLILGPPAALSLPLWFASGWLNLHSLNPFLRFVDASEFRCSRGPEVAPHIQADGEWIGHTPMQVSLVPNALRLLVPYRDQDS
jgi:YegS/Rv2252/BmrU family lipid kinase